MFTWGQRDHTGTKMCALYAGRPWFVPRHHIIPLSYNQVQPWKPLSTVVPGTAEPPASLIFLVELLSWLAQNCQEGPLNLPRNVYGCTPLPPQVKVCVLVE